MFLDNHSSCNWNSTIGQYHSYCCIKDTMVIEYCGEEVLVTFVDVSSLIVESGLPASRAEETSPQKVSEGSVCDQSVGVDTV